MEPIFCHYKRSDFQNCLTVLLGSSNDLERAKGLNLQHDCRVSQERFESFEKCRPAPNLSAANIKKMFTRYAEDFSTEFKSSVNDNNLATTSLGPSARFIHVFRFDEWVQLALRKAARNDEDYMSAYGTMSTPVSRLFKDSFANFDRWVGEQLQSSPASREQLIQAALEAVWDYGSEDHAVWATTDITFWGQLAKSKKSISNTTEPDRWFQLVGLHSPSGPRWALLLAYPAPSVAEYFRPCLLEAKLHEKHFPSPPDSIAGPGLGGYSMDLAATADNLVQEFVHPIYHWELDHWRQAGEQWGRASGRDPATLPDQRQKHHNLLSKRFSAVPTWLAAAL